MTSEDNLYTRVQYLEKAYLEMKAELEKSENIREKMNLDISNIRAERDALENIVLSYCADWDNRGLPLNEAAEAYMKIERSV